MLLTTDDCVNNEFKIIENTNLVRQAIFSFLFDILTFPRFGFSVFKIQITTKRSDPSKNNACSCWKSYDCIQKCIISRYTIVSARLIQSEGFDLPPLLECG